MPIIGRASATSITPIAAMRRILGRPAKRSRSVRLLGACAAEEIAKRSDFFAARVRQDHTR